MYYFTCGNDLMQCSEYNFTISTLRVKLREDQMRVAIEDNDTDPTSICASLTLTCKSATSPYHTLTQAPNANANVSGRDCSSATLDIADKNKSLKLAAVGIGVGIPLSLALSGAMYLLRQEQKKTRAVPEQSRHRRMTGYGLGTQRQTWELDSRAPKLELGDGSLLVELPSARPTN